MLNTMRFFLKYVAVAFLGTAIVLLAVVCLRVWLINMALRQAEAHLTAGHPRQALEVLEGVAPWVSVHPLLVNRHAGLSIKCHIRQGEVDNAESVAEALFTSQYPQFSPCPGVLEKLLVLVQPVVKLVLTRDQAFPDSDRGFGYRLLAEELSHSGRTSHLEELNRRLAFRHPRDLQALKIRAEIASLTAEPRETAQPDNARRARSQEHKSIDSASNVASRVIQQPTGPTAPEISFPRSADVSEYTGPPLLRSIPAETARRWAVVKGRDVKAYDSSGKFLRHLPPGTVVEVTALRNSNVGEVALCTTNSPGSSAPLVLVRSSDLEFGVNTTGPAARAEQELRTLRAKLEAELAHRLEIDPGNPHAREYEAAKRAYDEFWRTVRELQAKRDSATGDRRMRYSDELYRLKGRAVTVGQQYEAAKKKYDAWQKEAGTRGRTEDTDVAEIRHRLAEIEKQIVRLNGGN